MQYNDLAKDNYLFYVWTLLATVKHAARVQILKFSFVAFIQSFNQHFQASGFEH